MDFLQIKNTKEQIGVLPSTIGVYFFVKGGKIQYIGKSVNIKARILSHLENAKISPKEAAIAHADTIRYIATDSEFKALLLEADLIQKHRPKYNVIWKDDKSYLYIKITVKDEFPKLFPVRKENDGKSLYLEDSREANSARLTMHKQFFARYAKFSRSAPRKKPAENRASMQK